jgi:hypothetical protein
VGDAQVSDSTEIALALISTVGGIVSAWMSGRARQHASSAKKSADVAVEASLRPGKNGHGTSE